MEKNIPPETEKKTCVKMSPQSSQSERGEQFMLLDRGAKARTKGVLFADAGSNMWDICFMYGFYYHFNNLRLKQSHK